MGSVAVVDRRTFVQGRPAVYSVAGEGMPVVLLHGWALAHHTYRGVIETIAAQGCQVIAPAMPGFGGTSDLPGDQFSLRGYAQWVADLLDSLDIEEPAVVVGHSFSAFLNFTGGKSVASFIGAFLYLTPLPLLACALVLLVLLAVTRYMSLASIVAVGSLPVACWLILQSPWPVLLAAAASAALVISRHRGNIERLRAGRENVFSLSKQR